MNRKMDLSRRGFLKAASAAAGAAIGGHIAGPLMRNAGAQAIGGEKSALVVLYLGGGYNSLFTGPDAFLTDGTFGVTNGNVMDLGNGLFTDAPTFGTMPAFARSHMASIGIRHQTTSHEESKRLNWTVGGNRAYPLILANEMGGDAAIKCAAIRDRPDMDGVDVGTEGGVSMQVISNMDATIRALGGGEPDPRVPDRDIAAKGITAARTMSAGRMVGNAKSLVTVKDGYDTAIDALVKPVKPFVFADLANAYGHPVNQFGTDSFRARLVAAELMVLAGANVITIEDGGWDTHEDRDGSNVRDMMMNDILPSVNTFLQRMLQLEGYNVVFTIMGDFARSLPGSDHQPNMTATVIGKYVKTGTTGKTDNDVALPATTPRNQQYWAYLSKALKVPTEPFGPDPHKLIL